MFCICWKVVLVVSVFDVNKFGEKECVFCNVLVDEVMDVVCRKVNEFVVCFKFNVVVIKVCEDFKNRKVGCVIFMEVVV